MRNDVKKNVGKFPHSPAVLLFFITYFQVLPQIDKKCSNWFKMIYFIMTMKIVQNFRQYLYNRVLNYDILYQDNTRDIQGVHKVLLILGPMYNLKTRRKVILTLNAQCDGFLVCSSISGVINKGKNSEKIVPIFFFYP